ncbi:MAG: ABC transporter permease [Micrococcales bacterium]|nr:ABC transporter permease [Micrococcales bacterium]
MRRSSWVRGTTTVVGLELRQRVRARRWWVVLVVWTVLIGAFTLLVATRADDSVNVPWNPYENGPDQMYCGSYQVGQLTLGWRGGPIDPQADTTVEGCELWFYVTQPPTTSPSDLIEYTQTICSADDDGQVRCRVVEWVTLGGTTCYDIGAGPVCFQYDPNGGKVSVDGPPPPVLEVECTNTADGSAICHLPADVDTYDGTTYRPPQTCTIRYEPGQGQGWGSSDYDASCVWDPVDGWTPSSGPLVFGAVVLLVLALGLLVTPALTAGAINGDRQAGTLATLQATTLSATQIATGKLVFAWLTMAAFLVTALPWIGTAAVVGGASVFQVLGCCVVLMLELAVMCAVGLGWSALVNRTSASNLLAYGTALTLSVLTVVFHALLIPLAERDIQVKVWRLPPAVEASWDAELKAYYDSYDPTAPPPTPPECAWFTETNRQPRTDLTWWLLVPNPFVMVADASPEPEIARTHRVMYEYLGNDPLFQIRRAVAEQAAGPYYQEDRCSGYDYYYYYSDEPRPTSPVEETDPSRVRVWPWSLAANLLLGGTFFTIAVRRLKVPYHKLPKGTRVA